MKRIAINACRMLAERIFDSAPNLHIWQRADRIERRWHIQDATQARFNELKAARDQFLRDECAKHDRLHPDRLSYLHR